MLAGQEFSIIAYLINSLNQAEFLILSKHNQRIMKNVLCVSLIFVFTFSISAQKTVSYDDVLVIANTMSPQSMEIAKYFQTKRNIPEENIIEIEIFPSETINDFELEDMISQIKSQVLAHPKLSDLNYIVTTKGVPLKLNDYCGKEIENCKSIDEELVTIISKDETILSAAAGSIQNPYYNLETNFSRSEFDIFLVTRLDGYNVKDVKNLIDRSGYMTPVSKENSSFLFDVITSTDSGLESYFYKAIAAPISGLIDQEWNIRVGTETGVLKNQSDVLGLHILSSDKTFETPNHTMIPGSIGELSFCFSGASFSEDYTNDRIYAGEYIKNGITGLSAYTHITFLTPMTETNLLYDKFFSERSDYNLAESFYGSKKRLQLHRVVIGDPKSSVKRDTRTSEEEIFTASIDIFPNPSSGLLSIQAPPDFQGKLTIYDNLAQVISIIPVKESKIEVDLSTYPKGIYNFTFTSQNTFQTQKVIIQ